MGGISSCFAMNRQGKWDESPFHCRCHSSGRMSGNAETGKLGDRRKYDFVLYFNLHVYRRSWHRRGKSVCRLLENSECGSRSPDSAKSVKTSDRDIMTEEKRQLCSDLERSSTSLRSSSLRLYGADVKTDGKRAFFIGIHDDDRLFCCRGSSRRVDRSRHEDGTVRGMAEGEDEK